MAKIDLRSSVKHIQIDKANTIILVAATATVAILVFSIMATKMLFSQLGYQNKVIGLRSDANKQLVANINAVKSLETTYSTFEGSSESILGTKDKNSKIILDALPSKYDYPALVTSLDWLIKQSGCSVVGISGDDNEVKAEQDSIDPQPVEMPFQIVASGNYAAVQKLIKDMQKSIRPIKIISVSLNGKDSGMQASIKAVTYYQPAKKLGIIEKTVSNEDTNVKKTGATR